MKALSRLALLGLLAWLGASPLGQVPARAGPVFVGPTAANEDINISIIGNGNIVNIQKIFIGNIFNIGVIDPPLSSFPGVGVYNPFNGPGKIANAEYDPVTDRTTITWAADPGLYPSGEPISQLVLAS